MTEQQPLVSIVIPCYNHAQFVQETIQSVIDQDYANIELIIIDDGSKDNSVEVIQEMIPVCEERFVRFEFRHRPNKGLCATLNEALEWCEGEFFAPLASDDIILPHKTKEQVRFFLKNEEDGLVGVFGKVSLLVNTNIGNFNFKDSNRFELFEFNDIFLRKSKLPAPTAMLKTSKLKEIGGYNPDIKVEDFYMWLKLTEDGSKLVYIDTVFSFYRRHPGNFSQQSELMIAGVRDVLSSYSKRANYNEALARSYMVHAGDLAENRAKGSIRFVLLAVKVHFPLICSRSMAIYFYRALKGLR